MILFHLTNFRAQRYKKSSKRKVESSRQKAEGRKWKAESGRRKVEGGKRKAESYKGGCLEGNTLRNRGQSLRIDADNVSMLPGRQYKMQYAEG